MITPTDLQGCHVALITPLTRCASRWVIDYDHLETLINDCVDAGVAGILLAGTTGQSATLTGDEQVDLAARGAEMVRTRAKAAGRTVRVMASAGSNATHEALWLSQHIIEAAAPDALLHVTGYYNNPPQEGLRRHFTLLANLAAEFDTGIVLYQVPSRTASTLEVDTIVRLAKHPAIIAIKDAGGDMDATREVLERTDREQFAVLSGEDHLVHDIMRLGGIGVVSASANRWPREFQTLCDLARAGEWAKAAELQRALQPCVDATFAAKNPIPLNHMFGTTVRAPLVNVDELEEPTRTEVREAIDRALAIASFPHVPTEVTR